MCKVPASDNGFSTAAQKAALSTSPFFYSVPLQKSDFSATIEGSESSLAQQNNPIQIRWFIERMPPLPATSMHPEERMLRHLLTHLATKNSPMQIAQGRCFSTRAGAPNGFSQHPPLQDYAYSSPLRKGWEIIGHRIHTV